MIFAAPQWAKGWETHTLQTALGKRTPESNVEARASRLQFSSRIAYPSTALVAARRFGWFFHVLFSKPFWEKPLPSWRFDIFGAEETSNQKMQRLIFHQALPPAQGGPPLTPAARFRRAVRTFGRQETMRSFWLNTVAPLKTTGFVPSSNEVFSF